MYDFWNKVVLFSAFHCNFTLWSIQMRAETAAGHRSERVIISGYEIISHSTENLRLMDGWKDGWIDRWMFGERQRCVCCVCELSFSANCSRSLFCLCQIRVINLSLFLFSHPSLSVWRFCHFGLLDPAISHSSQSPLLLTFHLTLKPLHQSHTW